MKAAELLATGLGLSLERQVTERTFSQYDGGHLRPLDSWGREERSAQNSAGSEDLPWSNPGSGYWGRFAPGAPGGNIRGSDL
jgi:hypothetical protein